jgi:exodeoxyribonuclease VII large subunit
MAGYTRLLLLRLTKMKAVPVTLEVLNKKIKTLIKEGLDSHWVIAEISELSVNYSGHCYLELVQKSEKSEQLVARARAVIWSNTFRMLQPYFESTTGQPFSEGIKVMLRVVAEFHEVYGLSLNVVDIEPTYTVGELAVRKQKILAKLKEEGVLEMNQELELPQLLNRIAIVSSITAAGLKDFMDQLTNNPFGFKFYTKLFPAIMQGNEAEASIINQLDTIFSASELFDAVVIIRGGGASADLECFNSYWLAYNITQFPLPVLSGIGHEQDETVVDMVANTRLKTPTAVAEFLIDKMSYTENELMLLQNSIAENTLSIIRESDLLLKEYAFTLQKLYTYRIQTENKQLNSITLDFISSTKNRLFSAQKTIVRKSDKVQMHSLKHIEKHHYDLFHTFGFIKRALKFSLSEQKHQIDKAEQMVHHTSPKHVLSRGYSITLKDGKNVKNASELKSGDIIESLFFKGKKQSRIK